MNACCTCSLGRSTYGSYAAETSPLDWRGIKLFNRVFPDFPNVIRQSPIAKREPFHFGIVSSVLQLLRRQRNVHGRKSHFRPVWESRDVVITRFGHYVKLASKPASYPGGLRSLIIVLGVTTVFCQVSTVRGGRISWWFGSRCAITFHNADIQKHLVLCCLHHQHPISRPPREVASIKKGNRSILVDMSLCSSSSRKHLRETGGEP